MTSRRHQRNATLTALTALLAALSAGCGTVPSTGRDPDCPAGVSRAAHGSSVTIMSGIRDVEAAGYKRALLDLERCTGIDIVWDDRISFDADFRAALAAGTPPPLAILPRHGLLREAAGTGLVKRLDPQLREQVKSSVDPVWRDHAAVYGTLYAVPLNATVTSWIWYSPREFRRRHWTVPATWAQLHTFTTEATGRPGITPWCEGIAGEGVIGAPLTGWLADAVLRSGGVGAYQRWSEHKVRFSDPIVQRAFADVGWFLQNPAHVNGGLGDVASIARTSPDEAELAVLDGRCALYRGRSADSVGWPDGTTLAPDGDIWAFPVPPADPATRPVIVAGDVAARFSDDPAAIVVQTYLASPSFARERSAQGGWISPQPAQTVDDVPAGLDREAVRLLRDPDTDVVFDAAAEMPAAIGGRAFPAQATSWLLGRPAPEVGARIDRAWDALAPAAAVSGESGAGR